jgi:hypothetical protein
LFSDDATDFEQRVVDDVQQTLHDEFVDTCWPRCPEHPHHPLWYSQQWWSCSQSGYRVARLGGLPNAETNGRLTCRCSLRAAWQNLSDPRRR